MSTLSTNPKQVLAACAAVTMLFGFGCKAKELGATVSDTQATKVDHTWVLAARSCWPSLAHGTEKYVGDALTDPRAFRGAFAAYATYNDADVESIASHPIDQAPDPDISFLREANGPILTRKEASTQQPPRTGTADARDAQHVPAEALCAIHPGTPVGFR